MKNCFRILCLLVFAASLFAAGCSRNTGADGSIQIKGSDTMVNLGQAWAEKYQEKYPEKSVAVTGGGSGTGIAALLNGTTDIAECSRRIKEKEMKQAEENGIHPQETVVAYDGIAVVVHPDNPVDSLTLAQLADIFAGDINNWNQLGGKDLGIVVLSREVNSGTHVYLKEHVLNRGDAEGREYRRDALLLPSSQAIADEVSRNERAIGYYGMGYISDKQKALPIAEEDGSPAVEPGIENVLSGDYPISRPLFMYTDGQPDGTAAHFIEFILSDEGQSIVKELGFVPVK